MIVNCNKKMRWLDNIIRQDKFAETGTELE